MSLIAINGRKSHGKNLVAKIIQFLTNPYSPTQFFEDIDYEQYSPWKQKMFAEKLKQIVCLLIGCTMEQLEDPELKKTELGEEWDCWEIKAPMFSHLFPLDYEFLSFQESQKTLRKMTPRLMMQLIGTQGGRDILHPNIWINSLFADYVRDTGFTYPCKRTDKEKDEVFLSDVETHKDLIQEQFEQKEIPLIITGDPEPYIGDLPNWVISDCRFFNEARAVKERDGLIFRIFRPGQLKVKYNKLDYYVSGIDKGQYHLLSNKGGTGHIVITTKEHIEFEEADDHESETQMDSYTEFDEVIINNGSIEDLIEKIKQVLIKHKIV